MPARSAWALLLDEERRSFASWLQRPLKMMQIVGVRHLVYKMADPQHLANPGVHLNQPLQRFEVTVEDGLAMLNFKAGNGYIDLLHTEVPVSSQGRGVGAALVKAALDHARTAHLQVVPSCPFVRWYMRRHPEYLDLLRP